MDQSKCCKKNHPQPELKTLTSLKEIDVENPVKDHLVQNTDLSSFIKSVQNDKVKISFDLLPHIVQQVLRISDKFVESDIKKAMFHVRHYTKDNQFFIDYKETYIGCIGICRSAHPFSIDIQNPVSEQTEFINKLESKVMNPEEFEKIKRYLKAGCSLKLIIDEGDSYVKKYYDITGHKSQTFIKRNWRKIITVGSILGTLIGSAIVIVESIKTDKFTR